MRRLALSNALLASLLLWGQQAFAETWQPYDDAEARFHLDLPTSSFRLVTRAPTHLSLSEIEGDAVIDIYTGSNPKHLSPKDFAAELSQGGQIKDITYRASGRTWFVISGHYARGTPPLIYYAKYIFFDDFRSVAGFEISYSTKEKLRMDPIVEHLQATFSVQ